MTIYKVIVVLQVSQTQWLLWKPKENMTSLSTANHQTKPKAIKMPTMHQSVHRQWYISSEHHNHTQNGQFHEKLAKFNKL
jgi:maltodextrin utilization protein YvdJ